MRLLIVLTIVLVWIDTVRAAGGPVYGSYQFVEDVLLIPERGTNVTRCRRFADSPSVTLMWWEHNRKEFDEAVAAINDALSTTGYSLRAMPAGNTEAQIKCFHPRNHFEYTWVRQGFWLRTPPDHWTWDISWDQGSRITKGFAITTTEGLAPDVIRYQTTRALLGAIGLNGWSSEVRDSIFSGKTQVLSATDRHLIKFFYTHVQPNAQAWELRNAFGQFWNP